jgi:hypothetical protein
MLLYSVAHAIAWAWATRLRLIGAPLRYFCNVNKSLKTSVAQEGGYWVCTWCVTIRPMSPQLRYNDTGRISRSFVI